MPAQMPLPIQTMYAELVERAHLGRLTADFDDPAGIFVKRAISGREYWYFRPPMVNGSARRDRYVGLDSPELQHRIAEHRVAKDSYKQRRALVSALIRTGMQGPDARTGRILEALSDAGVFRMRAVVVGTTAYQTYSGLLGMKLGSTNVRTDDLDLAQFEAISIAVDDQVDLPFLEILRRVDKHFEPIPEVFAPGRACHYALGDRYRVDLLTPNRGPDDESPVALPALQTDAQPLRYLDFLIYEEVQAVALFGAGVAINVPSPERYCLHKLIVSRMRIQTPGSQAKAQKDLRQAGELLTVLCDQRPYEIRDLWEELNERGPKWREKAIEAIELLDAAGHATAREKLESLVGSVGPKP
ncbi:nucleotidyltransferase family protein [Plastoroseomonas hellenica]|uniref:Nucleotidyltransferase-like domain-containing protein n=1 Tax=Plastoroseomonas hellenica TaxID=2687306 RepID=A0ABS5F3P9_9PROT|nr:GSU2403 family nucleotidyltransferase fold protein [Plastoroseomonas hellenica]MBR0645959.1 hypothetical protein [Plastoroseomonas hellenica]MBR0667172.1 hypothetical protein [Plastoroseomonas hellenica]